MKRKQMVIWLLAALLQAAWTVYAQENTVLLDGSGKGNLLEIRILEQNDSCTRIEMLIRGFIAEEQDMEGKTMHRIRIPEMVSARIEGKPDLPVLYRMIRIPAGSNASYRILLKEEERLDGVEPVPFRPEEDAIVPVLHPGTDPVIPEDKEDFFSLEPPGIMRGIHFVRFCFRPFRFDPAEKALHVIRRLIVDILHDSQGGARSIVPITQSGVFEPMYPGLLLNCGPELDQKERSPELKSSHEAGEKMLVVTTPQFAGELGEYVAWKESRGIAVEIDSLSAQSGWEAVKQKLQSRYDGEGLTYVVLIGDIDDVPSPEISEVEMYQYSDPVYSLLEGDDFYPDVLLSRIPAGDVEQVRNQIHKILVYEKGEFTETDWIARGVVAYDEVVVDGLNYDSVEEADKIAYIMDSHPEFFRDVIRISESDPDGRERFVDAIENLGSNIVMYDGHGNPYWYQWLVFTVEDVQHLQMAGKGFPFLFTGGCFTGHFSLENEDCMAEAWLNLGSVEEPAGAIAVLAGFTYLSGYPVYLAHKAVFNEGWYYTHEEQTIGALCHYAKIRAIQQIGAEEAQSFFQCWTLFGDCSTPIRKKFSDVGIDSLSIDLPMELCGTDTVLESAGRIECSNPPESDLTIQLSSDDPNTVRVPSTVVIPEGCYFAVFDLTVSGSKVRTGSKQIVITATAPGYRSGASRIAVLPSIPVLFQNHPNPFNSGTMVRFFLPVESKVSIEICNIQGRAVRALCRETICSAGMNEVSWDGKNDAGLPVGSGAYFCRIRVGDFTQTRKMMVLR